MSQCRMVIARRLSGVVAISCIRLLRRLLQSLLLLRNDITTQSRRPVSSYFRYFLGSGFHRNDEKRIMQSSLRVTEGAELYHQKEQGWMSLKWRPLKNAIIPSFLYVKKQVPFFTYREMTFVLLQLTGIKQSLKSTFYQQTDRKSRCIILVRF